MSVKMDVVSRIRAALAGIRMAPRDERELQDAIARRLEAEGLTFEREVETGAGPVDFVVELTIAVEVKIAGGGIAIARQITRYMQSEQLTEAVLVTLRATPLPIDRVATDRGWKPIHVIELWRQCL